MARYKVLAIIYSKTKDDHYRLLRRVFSKLKKSGIKIHPQKSVFGVDTVKYLGYELGSYGYRPIQDKIDAIRQMTVPRTKTELKSFIGAITFYTQSLPMLQYTLQPLHSVSGSTDKFTWGPAQMQAFEDAKTLLSNCGSLAFPSLENDCQIYLTTGTHRLRWSTFRSFL